jgi:hypothetical protein
MALLKSLYRMWNDYDPHLRCQMQWVMKPDDLDRMWLHHPDVTIPPISANPDTPDGSAWFLLGLPVRIDEHAVGIGLERRDADR